MTTPESTPPPLVIQMDSAGRVTINSQDLASQLKRSAGNTEETANAMGLNIICPNLVAHCGTLA
ncbi:hypothetical protein [Kitasatospora purpeofusca]|uniref:FXSXX-COOH protein n=1 Tax=Kitasatospora purpeofusca TaxID=67352 RepID=A0ABZ1UBA4_9ACTN|nr:hypothetical protein [Kitasatospora purpeofusca]